MAQAKDLPRVVYTTGGQSYPEPGPRDNFSLNNRVRFVGDRVASVAAETAEIAQQALDLIEVEYELLTAIFDPRESMKTRAPILHEEPETWHIEDKEKNLAAMIDWELGSVEAGFEQSDASGALLQNFTAPIIHFIIKFIKRHYRIN